MTKDGFYQRDIQHSSEDDTWRTPQWLFDELDNDVGPFTLDAAALQSSTLVPGNWYGPDHPDPMRHDGLSRDWTEDTDGVVWLNPPYGNGVTRRWLDKAQSEASRGIQVVCLVPSRTGTLWFHDYCFPHRIRFLKRRIKFNNEKNNAPFDSAVVWMKNKPDPGYF